MNIEQKRNADALTIAPEGYLDTTTAPELKAVLDTVLAGVKELTFDFEKLEYISSSGLRIFLTVRKAAAAKGGKVIVKDINDDIRQVFMMTGFLNLFEIQ